MPLRNTAYLVFDHPTFGEGVFELRGAEDQTSLDREMLIGNRGQLVTSVKDIAPGLDSENASGYNIDMGVGRDAITLSFEIGHTTDAPRWGDGSAGESGSDAEGAHYMRQRDVLKYWARTSKTDSRNPAKLYWGEWTTGRFADSAGVYDQPFECVVMSLTTQYERDDPSAATGTVELLRTSSFPDILADEDGDIPGY